MIRPGGGRRHLLQLDREVLTSICSLLDPVSVAVFGCSSRESREAASQACLWGQFSTSRWLKFNTCIHAHSQHGTQSMQQQSQVGRMSTTPSTDQPLPQASTDFRLLYGSNNGWTPLRLKELHGHQDLFWPDYLVDFCVSKASASGLWSCAGDIVYTVGDTVEVWSTGDDSQPGKWLASSQLEEAAQLDSTCCVELAAGIAAVGRADGKIRVHDMRPGPDPASCLAWDNGIRYCFLSATYAAT